MFRITPENKKSFIESYHFKKEGIEVDVDFIWRWGAILLPELPEGVSDQGENDCFVFTDEHEYEFESADDGYFEIVNEEDLTPDLLERIQDLIAQSGALGLEEEGWGRRLP